MVPNYYLIQNGHLRMLVIASESIHSLPAEEIIKTVDLIAKLPSAGVEAMIKVLEDEQSKIRAAKRAQGITPEMELKQVKENQQKLVAIKKDFDLKVRNYRENKSHEKEMQAAEDILKSI